MSQAKPQRRLGRGLNSLLSVSELPVEVEITPPTEEANAGMSGSTATISQMSDDPSGAATSASATPITAPDTRPTPGPSAKGTNPNEIPVDQIVPNPHQPRRRFDEQTLVELANSLKVAGLIQPIIVRRVESGYQLIAGERRWRAAKLANLATIPAIIRDVDAYTQAQMALIENIQREELNAIDRAESYKSLMTQLGLTQAELAGRLGEDRSSIAHFLRLLDLCDAVRQLVRDNLISLGHAKLLATVSDPVEQQRLSELVLKQDLSVRNLERIIQQGPVPGKSPDEPKPASAHVVDLERSISRQLGMRVQVRAVPKKGRGRLVIHYGNLDQFDDLMKRLGVRTDD